MKQYTPVYVIFLKVHIYQLLGWKLSHVVFRPVS